MKTMFFLRHNEDPVAFYLFENKTYTIGRKQTDILIQDDNSISRQHATITLKSGCVTVTDLKAKYKTFINLEALQEHESRVVKNSDTIRFGIQKSIYKLEELKINTVCSGLNTVEKKKLSDYLNILNGHLSPNWNTECTHLTLQEIVLTIKVLCALIEGQQIVTLKYWEDFVASVENNLPPPRVEDYKPLSAESILNKNISFKYNALRKSLFSNKVFVFSTAHEKNKMDELIKLAGGQSISWNEKPLKPADFHNTDPQYIMIQEQTQIKGNDDYNNLTSYLSQIDKRLIPQQEIAIAIVTCSCEQNCNPSFNRGKTLIHPKLDLVKTQDVLVAQTPSQSQIFFSEEDKKPSLVVPPSVDDDVFAVGGGPVTSTQIEVESPAEFKPFSIEEVSGIKREGELLETTSSKRPKIQECKGSQTKQSPFDDIKFTQSKKQQSSKEQQKSLDISNPQEEQSSRNENSITSTRTFNFKNVIQSRKRNSDDDYQFERPLKKSNVVNPFSALSRRKFVSTPVSSNNKPKKIDDTDSGKPNRMKSKSAAQTPISKIVVLDPQLESSFPWISKSSIKISSPLGLENNKSADMTDAEINYINSFKNCVISKTLPLIVRKPLTSLSTENVSPGVKNFKKFKKVQPLHPQTTIIPNSAYKIVRCGEDLF